MYQQSHTSGVKIYFDQMAGYSCVTPREEKIVRMRFGIGEPQEYSFEAISKKFGITRERVRQIEIIALKKLRVWEKKTKSLRAFLDDTHK